METEQAIINTVYELLVPDLQTHGDLAIVCVDDRRFIEFLPDLVFAIVNCDVVVHQHRISTVHLLTVGLAFVDDKVPELLMLAFSLKLVHFVLRVDFRNLETVEELGVWRDANDFSFPVTFRRLAHHVDLSTLHLAFHSPAPALVDVRVPMDVKLGIVLLVSITVHLALRVFHLVVDEGACAVLYFVAFALLLLADLLGLLFRIQLSIRLVFSFLLLLGLEVVLHLHDLNGQEQGRVRRDPWLADRTIAELCRADDLDFCTLLQSDKSLVEALELCLADVERIRLLLFHGRLEFGAVDKRAIVVDLQLIAKLDRVALLSSVLDHFRLQPLILLVGQT